MGIDDESKGYRIYWPGKNRVSIERDVYFNEDEALEPEEIPIEGGYDIFTNSEPLQQSDTSQIAPKPSPPVENVPNTPNETPKSKNLENAPEIHPETPETQPETHIPAPHQRSAR